MEEQSEFSHPMTSPPSEHAPMHPPHHAAKKAAAKRKKLLLIGGGAALVLALAVGAYFMFMGKEAKKPVATTSTAQQSTPQVLPPTPTDATPVTYKSTKLNIELTHRKDWTFKEATDGEITLSSPRTSYTKADDTAATGTFVLKIRKGVSTAMQQTVDTAIATRDSKVIAYAAPTEQQRFYTNLSYGGGTAEVFNFFIVTGSTEFKAGGPFAYALQFGDDSFLIAGGFGSASTAGLGFDAVMPSSIDDPMVEAAVKIVESLKIF